MAKSSKIEDYWREHAIENLFKELTQLLARRLPSDPAVTIVQHIQKKYPKSFKTSTASDVQNQSSTDTQSRRSSSVQSQVNDSFKIPTIGSAFTEFLKKDASASKQMPEFDSKPSPMTDDRFPQKAFRLKKNTRSDHDILQEETFKPTQENVDTIMMANTSMNSLSEDLRHTEVHEEPSVAELIKYKHRIRTICDRHSHRRQLAELAQSQHEKEELFHLDTFSNLNENEQSSDMNQLNNIGTSSQVVPISTNDRNSSYKSTVKSKDEEELLNDENIFQSGTHRSRVRQRVKSKPMKTLKNTHDLHGSHSADFRSSSRKDNGNLVCNICGNVVTFQENPFPDLHQQISPIAVPSSLEPQISSLTTDKKSEAIDDWFQSSVGFSDSRQSTSLALSDVTSPQPGSSTFRRNLFRPINDLDDNNTTEQQSHNLPFISSDDETKFKKLKSPPLMESGVFGRSPEKRTRTKSLSKTVQSPVAIKNQTPIENTTSHQTATDAKQTTSARSTPSSVSEKKINPGNERRMSGWSVRENSPTDSD